MARLLWICLGGAVGTGARYLVASWLPQVLGTGFPYATLAVNVLGSFLLAVLMQAGVMTDLMTPTVRLALTTGVMGGFTTYSTFSYETMKYLESGAFVMGAVHVAVTVLGCLGASVLGMIAGRAWAGA